MGEVCGAVSGALMVIGLKYGWKGPEDKEWRERTYAVVRDFAARFKARNKTIVCRELLGCDIGTPEGMAAAREKKLITTLCPGFVKDAVEILEDFIS